MAANAIRCQRCLKQKKGCEGGHPCLRCRNAGAPCVPETEGNPKQRKNAARRQQNRGTSTPTPGSAPAPAPTSALEQQPSPATMVEGADQAMQDAVGDESDDQGSQITPVSLFDMRPRATSLRTKDNGPDMWPHLNWVYLGNGQYCQVTGYARVMAKKQAAAQK